ncbi:riboflavin synthase [Thalassotalea euphylliae]|uniref:Riboflavin synthase n=1 Tax=Thalassotalea euphylliae TaxID=1655234 RepID=A0A3E0TTC4_9GAMM|nr:riboflavin synthase [Thalassotalea euphylliae]REL27931.1 riboflavin synthase [Thalassotalea euphylliae]
MFTGIIEAVGTIAAIQMNQRGAAITVNVGKLDMADVKLGDSIATNGICLTVVHYSERSFTADVSNETLTRTGFANYQVGQKVNLEKAMLPTTRFGGHMVSGHVDAVAEITSITQSGNSWDYWIAMDAEIAPYIAEKGSITIDGVSLTVNSLTSDQFRLTIVPHTAQETIIADYQVGTKLNIEVDVVARYIERLLTTSHQPTDSSGVSQDLLARSGFIK